MSFNISMKSVVLYQRQSDSIKSRRVTKIYHHIFWYLLNPDGVSRFSPLCVLTISHSFHLLFTVFVDTKIGHKAQLNTINFERHTTYVDS